MVAFLRAIGRTPEYRNHAGKLINRFPDEIWYEPGEGWAVTFWLQTRTFGQRLLYILREPSGGRPAIVTGVHWVSVEGGETPNPEQLTS